MRKLLRAGAVVLVAALQAGASIVYQETFDNSTGGNVAYNSSPTNVHVKYGCTVHETGNGNYANNANWAVSSGNGDQGAGLATGFLFNSSYGGFGGDLTRTLAWTEEIGPLSVNSGNITSVWWKQGHATNAPGTRVALKVGGAWYASQVAPTQSVSVATGGNFSNQASLVTLPFAGASWFKLNFNGTYPSTSSSAGLSIGASTNLPSGTVQAIGLYIHELANPGVTRRFDTFTVQAIPEPGALSTVALGLGALGALARRRRR